MISTYLRLLIQYVSTARAMVYIESYDVTERDEMYIIAGAQWGK